MKIHYLFIDFFYIIIIYINNIYKSTNFCGLIFYFLKKNKIYVNLFLRKMDKRISITTNFWGIILMWKNKKVRKSKGGIFFMNVIQRDKNIIFYPHDFLFYYIILLYDNFFLPHFKFVATPKLKSKTYIKGDITQNNNFYII